MTTTPRRAPKPAPPPSPIPETKTTSQQGPFPDLPTAFLAWQQQQPALADVSTLSELLQLVRSLNGFGMFLRHELDESDAAIRLNAVLEHVSAEVIRSGPLPLPIQSTAADFIQARILTTELVLGIARDATTADFEAPADTNATDTSVTVSTTPVSTTPVSTPVTPAAAPTPTPAPQAEIDALRLQIETLPADWQAYLTEAFRAQFGLAADQKVSPAIKSTEHLAFLRSILPGQSVTADDR